MFRAHRSHGAPPAPPGPWGKAPPRTLLSLMLAVGLAACGGGAPPDRLSAASPRLHALSATASATALLDWAEQHYPSYFPGHRADQFLAPYTYRFYPETGIYLGVAEGKVYVMGGSFGTEPLYVGLVSDFLPATPSQPPGTGNGCWDLDFMETPGRHIVVESRTTDAAGAVSGGMTQEWQVLGPRSFEGRSLLATDTTVTLTLPTGATSSVQRNTSYTQRSAEGGVTLYGDEGSMTMGGFTTSFRTVFTPPWTDTQQVLEPGESVVETWTGTTTTQGQTNPLRGSRTIRFVARETLTVPAGSFETCRFEQTQPPTPGTLSTWIARGWGLPVQTTSTANPGSFIRAQRITIDGAAVGQTAAAAGP